MNESAENSRIAPNISLIGLLASAVLIVVGNLWSTFGQPEHVWSEAEAEEYAAASAALHNTTNHPGHGPGEDHSASDHEAEHSQARARFEKIREELDAAQYAKHDAGGLLIRIGLIGMACSGAMYLMTRGS
ncbi:hypothetical protein OAS39_01510 [Pirellulales bacterium]|nr:hypothetical protein [Pirellulales bacterium]